MEAAPLNQKLILYAKFAQLPTCAWGKGRARVWRGAPEEINKLDTCTGKFTLAVHLHFSRGHFLGRALQLWQGVALGVRPLLGRDGSNTRWCSLFAAKKGGILRDQTSRQLFWSPLESERTRLVNPTCWCDHFSNDFISSVRGQPSKE